MIPTCAYDKTYDRVDVSIKETRNTLSIVVGTKRLKIVSVNNDKYNTDFIKLYGDKKVNELVGTGATLKPEQVVEKVGRWNRRIKAKNPFTGYVVLDLKGKFVGQIILKPIKDKEAGPGKFVKGVCEIGYLSMPQHWGKKYGQEFTHAMVHHLVPELIKANYCVAGEKITSIIATTRTDNIASKKVLEKFLTHTGTKPRYGGMREWYEHKYHLNRG